MAGFGSGNYYRPSFFGGFSFFPPVIKMLLLINGGVFLLMAFFGTFRVDGIPLRYVFDSYLGLMPLGYGFWPWQLITYQFIHADFFHLLFNMAFGLWMFGTEVEHMWGGKRFLRFYLGCGVAAGLAQLVLSPIFDPGQAVGPTVGASGAVYGVLVAFAVMFPDRQIYLYFLIPVRVKYFVMFLIVVGVMSVGAPGNVANLAHLGGALAGYIFILMQRRSNLRGSNQFINNLKEAFMFRKSPPSSSGDAVKDTPVFDIRETARKPEEERPTIEDDTQKKIDAILDKISQRGYQSLSEEEKKVLFDASKKLN
jgi:membrane associated rhomboid family serine protease